MNLHLFDKVLNIYEEMQSEKTQDELAEIFKVGTDMVGKVEEMFAIGKDAADDVVRISLMFMALVDRMAQPEGQRALPKPMKECHTLADIAALL